MAKTFDGIQGNKCSNLDTNNYISAICWPYMNHIWIICWLYICVYVYFCMLYVDWMLIINWSYVDRTLTINVYTLAPKTITYWCVDDKWKCIVECLVEMHEQPLNKLLGGIASRNVAPCDMFVGNVHYDKIENH